MGVLYSFLILVEMVVCALLIVVIFMQKSKGGMGGSAFGGGVGEAIFGSRMGNVLTKATVVLGVIFLANTLVLTVLTSRRGLVGSVMEGVVPRPVAPPQQPMAQPPVGVPPGWMDAEMPPEEDFDMPVMEPALDATEVPLVVPSVVPSVVPGEGSMDEDVLVIPPVDEAEGLTADPVEIPDVDLSTAADDDSADLGE